MAKAAYFVHTGSQGDAMLWGVTLSGYAARGSDHLDAGDGWRHPGQCAGRAVLQRASLYSERSVAVLGQPGRVAWKIFDERLHAMGGSFEDYRNAEAVGAIKWAETVVAPA